MEIFGIGPLELLLIVLIAIVVLGPKDMMKTAQKAATWLKKLRQSEIWSSTKEVMDIPNQVMRETGLDKEIHELQTLTRKGISDPVWQPNPLSDATKEILPEQTTDENRILPEQNPTTKSEEKLDGQSPQDEKQ